MMSNGQGQDRSVQSRGRPGSGGLDLDRSDVSRRVARSIVA
jgi:hypothetical protein